MGSVYRAVDEVLGKEVALKFLDEQLAEGQASFGRLRDEVLLAQEVSHKNVCRTYDLEEVEDRWVVKMEYVDGETLAQRVARVGPLDVSKALAIARQIAEGLGAAHERGVVHRDLKPHNVLLEAATGRVVLMDFGLARMAELAGHTAEGIAGTPEFMSPEQARGREVDGRADLYALGCVLYYMLVGEVVFPAKGAMASALRHVEDPAPDVRAKRPDVPGWLAAVIARLLEKDPAGRFADAPALVAALAGPRSRRPRVAAVGLGVVALVAAGLAWRALRLRPEWRPVVRELQPSYEENSEEPVFSPDGTLIAYPTASGPTTTESTSIRSPTVRRVRSRHRRSTRVSPPGRATGERSSSSSVPSATIPSSACASRAASPSSSCVGPAAARPTAARAGWCSCAPPAGTAHPSAWSSAMLTAPSVTSSGSRRAKTYPASGAIVTGHGSCTPWLAIGRPSTPDPTSG